VSEQWWTGVAYELTDDQELTDRHTTDHTHSVYMILRSLNHHQLAVHWSSGKLCCNTTTLLQPAYV